MKFTYFTRLDQGLQAKGSSEGKLRGEAKRKKGDLKRKRGSWKDLSEGGSK